MRVFLLISKEDEKFQVCVVHITSIVRLCRVPFPTHLNSKINSAIAMRALLVTNDAFELSQYRQQFASVDLR